MSATRPRFHTPTWYREAAEALVDTGALGPLRGRHRCRVAIVGAGLAGLSTARSLAARGAEGVVVLEAGEPGEGASGRNGGFVFGGYSLDSAALVRQVGTQRAREMHRWTRAAVRLIRRRCHELGCPVHGRGVLMADWFHDNRQLAREQDWLARTLGIRHEWIAPEEMSGWVSSRRYGAGLLEPGAFHFNPLAYIRRLAAGVTALGVSIHGQSPVTGIRHRGGGWEITTDEGSLHADRVVVATGGYGRGLPGAHSIQPIATYVQVSEPLGVDTICSLLPGGAAVYDTRFAFDYYRPLPDTRLLWGGRISVRDRSPQAIERLLRRDLARVFPELAGVGMEYRWGGWMSYARHQMPILREHRPGLWLGLAFGGHGLATTTLAGEVLAAALTGDRRRLAAFQRWSATWAGGLAGRAAVQSIYSARQAGDRIREWRGPGRV